MGIQSDTRSFQKRFLFQVEFEGLDSAEFTTCSGLQSALAVIEHWQGGRLTARKEPGRKTFQPLTLERGRQNGLLGLYQWHLQAGDASIGRGVGLPDPQFRRNGELIQYDRDGSILTRWRIIDAWVSDYTAGEWDNTVDENLIERAVIVFDDFRLVEGSR